MLMNARVGLLSPPSGWRVNLQSFPTSTARPAVAGILPMLVSDSYPRCGFHGLHRENFTGFPAHADDARPVAV